MTEETEHKGIGPDNFDFAALVGEFSPEEQNAAAWLSVVLLLAENRAYCDALRKAVLEKGLLTADELNDAISTELTQPNLGNWYGFMNQLHAYRVTETLDLQKRKRDGSLDDSEVPLGDLTEVNGDTPIPQGPPPVENIVPLTASTNIVQTEEEKDGE